MKQLFSLWFLLQTCLSSVTNGKSEAPQISDRPLTVKASVSFTDSLCGSGGVKRDAALHICYITLQFSISPSPFESPWCCRLCFVLKHSEKTGPKADLVWFMWNMLGGCNWASLQFAALLNTLLSQGSSELACGRLLCTTLISITPQYSISVLPKSKYSFVGINTPTLRNCSS